MRMSTKFLIIRVSNASFPCSFILTFSFRAIYFSLEIIDAVKLIIRCVCRFPVTHLYWEKRIIEEKPSNVREGE